MAKITLKKLRKMNKWIKSDKQAQKIIKTYYNTPKTSLQELIIEVQRFRLINPD